MTRVALYARFSDPKQNPLSIADQLALLMRHAAAQGWEVVASYTDAAISGFAMANRPGLIEAVEAAERGEYEILLAEEEDRIARNLEHLAHVKNRLDFVGARIATLQTAHVDSLHVALKGLIGEDYLRGLSQKTRRGVRANAEKGLWTGARLYGYRSRPGGQAEIVAAEAEVVRRVFRDYAAGESPRAIAEALNRERVPGPRGGWWNQSSIAGSKRRGNGLLHTELYAGTKVWNRMEVRKDPRTGRRTPRMRPETEWRRTPVPQLRIVGQALWDQVQARLAATALAAPQRQWRRPPWLFAGLVRCGRCGSSYTVCSTDRLACAGYVERGPSFCANRRQPSRTRIETAILDGLQATLLSPEAIAQAVSDYRAAAEARKALQAGRRDPLERRLAEVKRGIERVVDAIVEGAANTAMKERMAALDAERLEIEAALAASAEPEPAIVALHPGVGPAYARVIGELRATLGRAAAGDTPARRELVASIRDLVERIELTPRTDERRCPVDIAVHGRLVGFLQSPSVPQSPAERMGALVAGGGFGRPQRFIPIRASMVA